MTRSINKLDAIKSGFMRNGIIGRYSPADNSFESRDRITAVKAALDARSALAIESDATYAIASTGHSHALPDGGIAAITGRPYFRDRNLAELASQQGVAAALAAGYTQYSEGVFTHLFGAFSCVVIDKSAGRVLIAIDRIGQHSMYYQATAGELAFGSSAGVTLACANAEAARLNQGVYNYLYFHMVPGPGSVYRGLNKLPAAHYLDYCGDGKSRLVNYWCPQFSEVTKDRSFEDMARQLRSKLRSSVEKCLTDTGKIGSFLSGGLDSSTVTGFLAELREGQAAAYSIGFAAEGYDEMAFARITANHFGVELNEYYVTPEDVVDELPTIATSYDEPFGNSSALPAYFCAKMAAENGVDTLFAGDGGDEFFGGNERYIKQRAFEYYAKIPTPLRRGLLEPLVKLMPAALPLVSKARSYIAQANTPLPDRLQSYNFLHRHAAAEIFSDEFLREVDEELPLNLLRSIYHRPQPASELNRMLYLDWQITLADNDLRKVTQTCALAGVDVVYPMLDDDLVEFSCGVPSAWKIKGKDLRHFYKQALKDWLPRQTIEKTKQGFGLPFGVWMRTYQPLRELAYDNLLQLKDRDFIRPEFIDRAIEMHQSQHAAYYGELVWILTVFELWMQGHSGTSR